MLNQTLQSKEQQQNLKKDFFQRWITWHNQVKQQRILAIKVFQFQNSIQQKRLRQTFLFLKFNNQQNQQQLSDNLKQVNQKVQNTQNDDQMYNLGLAIQYDLKSTYAKVIRAWISYMNSCRKFDASLSAFYIKFLLKKYFHIVHNYSIQCKIKKAKKAQYSKAKSQTAKPDTFNIQSHLNFLHMNSDIKEVEIPLSQQKSPYKIQKQGYNKGENIQPKTFYNFTRQKFLGESQRSQFSSLTVGLEFQSKRKFKPITQLPSMPNLQNIRRIKQIQNNTIKQIQNNTLKQIQKKTAYQIQKKIAQQIKKEQFLQILPKRQTKQTIKQQKKIINNSQNKKNNQVQINSTISNLIIKQKLITFMFLNGQQFKQSQQFSNYRLKTLNYLQKIKFIKLQS